MSLTADDGIRVFVDGEDVTDKVEVDVHSVAAGATGTYDITSPTDIAVVAGDTVSFSWSDSGIGSKVVVTPHAPLSGSLRVTGWYSGFAHGSGFYLAPEPDSIEISPEDYAIIDEFIIDSVAAGHARRL